MCKEKYLHNCKEQMGRINKQRHNLYAFLYIVTKKKGESQSSLFVCIQFKSFSDIVMLVFK